MGTMGSATYLGTSDEVTTCDCCGKRDLKSTVALCIGEAVDPVFYGVSCAAKALKVAAKEVRAGTKLADIEKRRAAAAARDAAFRAAFARDQLALDARFPALAGNRFAQVQAMHAEGLSWSDVTA